MEPIKKAVIFAPFWRQTGHIGNNRVDRFVRWLAADGFHIVMIRAGSSYAQRQETWGTELTIRDPLGIYRENSSAPDLPSQASRLKQIRRNLAYWLFNPDPSIVWAWLAARHPKVLEQLKGASFILSSNPPESAHVGAWYLSKKFGLPHIVDMRDGWLDEPLRPLLQTSSFRRWRERSLEKKILCGAASVLVTSEVWRALLCQRLPEIAHNISILTNGYPLTSIKSAHKTIEQNNKGLVLLYGGRFRGSDSRRSPSILLNFLLQGIKDSGTHGTLKLIGSLSSDELKIITRFANSFKEADWEIECLGYLERNDLLDQLPKADGLLLLSVTFAQIPCKLFEYIPTQRPILVVAEPGSATWAISSKLPQAFLAPLTGENDREQIKSFLEAARNPTISPLVPHEFSEAHLSMLFRQILPHK